MADNPLLPPEPSEPPSNVEAEQALLGSLMHLGERALDRLGGMLRPEHFAFDGHSCLFTAICSIIERGGQADPATVLTSVRDDPRFSALGGPQYIARLFGASGTAGFGPSLLVWRDDIIGRWRRRKVLLLAEEMASLAMEGGDSAMDETLAAAQVTLDDIRHGSGGESYRHYIEHYRESIEDAQAAQKRGGRVVGVTTGLVDLDGVIDGLQRSDLIICGARPGMGKSALGVCIARAAARAGVTVGIWTLEMAGRQVAGRSAAIDAGISYSALRGGRLSDDDWSRMAIAEGHARNLPIYIDQTAAIRPSALASTARRIKRRHGLGLIIVDYLQLMRGDTTRRDGNKNLEISEITGALKALAKDLDVPVLAFSQLNRGVEAREDKRPALYDLRDSGSIEQDADIIMFLFREEYYLQKEGEPKRKAGEEEVKHAGRVADYMARLHQAQGVGEVIVGKQRNGPECTVRVAFDASLMEYRNLHEGARNGRFI